MRITATTTSGPVRGTWETADIDGEVVAFRGIPYAAPLLHDRRWQAPVPPLPWHEPLDATRFGPSAPQSRGGPLAGLVPGMTIGETDEDCLTLNVWTPAADDVRRPVLVWLHGGAFMIGGSSLETYDGSKLAAREDLVVVSCNYRLGALGFLLVDHSDAAANCGILDQIAALEWVRDNIAAFGGDPGRVAVFGESAGGGSVLSLLSAPRAAGLFRGAIVQSGATALTPSRERALEIADLFAGAAGVAPRDLGALRALPLDAVLAAQQRVVELTQGDLGLMPFQPAVDGDVLTDDWLGATVAGMSRDIALVIGTTRDELSLFASFDPAASSLDEDGLRRRFARVHPRPDELATAYRSVAPEALPPEIWRASLTDNAMWLPAVRIAEAHASHQPDTWMYRFDWPAAEPTLGACHGIDIPFPFDTIDRAGWDRFVHEPTRARALARQLQSAWAAMARTGAPGTDLLPPWPRYDARSRATLVLGPDARVELDPRAPVRAAWAPASTLQP